MKKNTSALLSAWLILSVTLGGCRSGIQPDQPEEHQVTFTAFSDAATRTYLSEGEERAVFYWDQEDEDRLLVWENGVAAKTVTLTTDESGRTAVITATFDGAPAGQAEYTAALSTLQNESNPTAPVILADQAPRSSSFDPDADILIAEPLTATPDGDLHSLVFQFHRPVAISKVTFKGLEPGETISAVGITADKALTGTYNAQSAAFTGGAQSISIDCYGLTQGTGDPSVFFITAPVSGATLSFRVITNRGSYRKTIQRTLSFATTAMTRFNVNLSGCKEEQPVDDTWKLLTSASELTAGKEIVFACNSKSVVAGSLSGTYLTSVEGSTFSSGNQTITKLADAAQIFTLGGSTGAWTFSNAGGQKLGTTAAKSLAWGSGATTWAITFSSGKMTVASTNSGCGTLQYNASSPRFTTYTSSQQAIQIYYRDGAGSGKPKLATPSVTCTRKGTTYLFFEWDPVPNAHHYGVIFDDGDEKLISSTTFVAQYLEEGSLHTIQVRAICDTEEYDNSSYASCSARTDTTQPQPDTDQKGWFELPVMYDANHDGICDTDNTLYYAYHEFTLNGKSMRNYTVCFSAEHHCPVWVAAPRHSCYVGGTSRTNAYTQDPNIPSGIQYKSKDTGGGCNKGHMLGSAERTCCEAANRQVFYYSNIAPQNSSTYNTGGGAWNNLEDCVDTYVVSDTLYEVIGCYFSHFVDSLGNVSDPVTISFGGRNDVTKPTMSYYALLSTKAGNSGKAVTQCSADELKCVAFIMSHTMPKGHQPNRRDMISIAQLEALTGFTYFPNVPNAPKDTFKPSDWGFPDW